MGMDGAVWGVFSFFPHLFSDFIFSPSYFYPLEFLSKS